MDLLSSLLRAPTAEDDKYSRGVVGFVTGSETYPGAAILGVTAAIRTGVGMVRWLGPETVGRLLIEVRPEVVLSSGRVQAWVVGSGVPSEPTSEQKSQISDALADPGYVVIDAGGLDIAKYENVVAKAILTPHTGEAVRLFSRFGIALSRSEIEAEPIYAASRLAELTGKVVLLKGNVTTVANSDGQHWQSEPSNPALATAGSGDVLAGILGALIASNVQSLDAGLITLEQTALAAVSLHSQAADLAVKDGPVAALDIANAIRTVVAKHLA